jgi:cell division septum initiation protein DivIVA
MNELRTEAKMALANYESSYGAFGKEASFSMDNVYVVQDYIDQLEADADKFANEIERLREEIHEYDDMIREAGWYLTDDGGNSYKSADEIISHFLLAKDKARAEQNAALKDGE